MSTEPSRDPEVVLNNATKRAERNNSSRIKRLRPIGRRDGLEDYPAHLCKLQQRGIFPDMKAVYEFAGHPECTDLLDWGIQQRIEQLGEQPSMVPSAEPLQSSQDRLVEFASLIAIRIYFEEIALLDTSQPNQSWKALNEDKLRPPAFPRGGWQVQPYQLKHSKYLDEYTEEENLAALEELNGRPARKNEKTVADGILNSKQQDFAMLPSQIGAGSFEAGGANRNTRKKGVQTKGKKEADSGKTVVPVTELQKPIETATTAQKKRKADDLSIEPSRTETRRIKAPRLVATSTPSQSALTAITMPSVSSEGPGTTSPDGDQLHARKPLFRVQKGKFSVLRKGISLASAGESDSLGTGQSSGKPRAQEMTSQARSQEEAVKAVQVPTSEAPKSGQEPSSQVYIVCPVPGCGSKRKDRKGIYEHLRQKKHSIALSNYTHGYHSDWQRKAAKEYAEWAGEHGFPTEPDFFKPTGLLHGHVKL